MAARRMLRNASRRRRHVLRRTEHTLLYRFVALDAAVGALVCVIVVIAIVGAVVWAEGDTALPAVASGFAVEGSFGDLERLLGNVTAGAEEGKLVVAVAVNYAFRRLVLNFVCNLRRLRRRNYIVLAMDRAVFHYLEERGVNVYFHADAAPVPRRRLLEADDGDAFGSSAFVETSRRKSALVLGVLRLGYSVVFSDVEVIWVRDPVPIMLAHAEDLVVQSDRRLADALSAPLNFNINSGLYMARSSPRTVRAFRAIMKYGLAVRRSEQKAFNYVLCGAFKDHVAGPGKRIGDDACVYRKGGATARVLPTDAFPNGSDDSLWTVRAGAWRFEKPKVIAAHANYISGGGSKISRIRDAGFWLYNDENPDALNCAPM